MEEKVSYIAFESEMTRMERVNRRLWILCILLLAALLLTNAAWLYYESQFETVETYETWEVTSDRGHAIYNESGEVNINGEGEADTEITNP